MCKCVSILINQLANISTKKRSVHDEISAMKNIFRLKIKSATKYSSLATKGVSVSIRDEIRDECIISSLSETKLWEESKISFQIETIVFNRSRFVHS